MVGPIIRLDKSITRAQSLQQVQPCTARGKKTLISFVLGSAYNPGDTVGVHVDFDAGKVSFYRNGTLSVRDPLSSFELPP